MGGEKRERIPDIDDGGQVERTVANSTIINPRDKKIKDVPVLLGD